MKISVIIPTIGRSTLEHVLQALFESDSFQTLQPEIIVVFDGHKPDINFPSHPGLTVIETGRKVYSGGARNVGMDKATGDIIAFIGDDTIPHTTWLSRVHGFHSKHSNPSVGLLGRIRWTRELEQNAFHQWLENNAQFDFKGLQKKPPTWRHFYTSNISFKKDILGDNRFSDQFIGWGFEDTEFGYRLAKKGLVLSYDPDCTVFHDHTQKEENVWEQTRNARKNGLVFEHLHPELKIVPRGFKAFLLKIIIGLLGPLAPFSQKVRWWRKWKKAWLGE